MSRFSQKKAPPVPDTVNRAGGAAHRQSPELALASLLLTSFVKDQYYRSGAAQVGDAKALVTQVDPEFAAKAAVFARREYGMRTISHVVAGEVAKVVAGHKWGKYFFDKIVFRPDDMIEIAAYWLGEVPDKTIPQAMKKGFAHALQRFDAYQLGKYRKSDKKVSLVDVVNMAHPNPTDAINKLMNGELRQEDTFEAKLSAAGSAEDKGAAKAEAWEDLVRSGKIGYFALLRNLRNMEQQASPETLQSALAILTSTNRIHKSKVLPFRYTTAFKEVSTRDVQRAISKAIDISVGNVPVFDGSTLVAVDVSGSMRGKSIEIAALFAAALYKSNNADLLLFDWTGGGFFSPGRGYQWLSPDPNGSVLGIAQQITDNATGGGTDFSLVFAAASERGKRYDRVILLTDMQAWVGQRVQTVVRLPMKEEHDRYCALVGHRPYIYAIDLTGYGDMQFPEDRVFALAGFSEKIFDLMPLLETGLDSLIERINSVDLYEEV